MRKFLGTVFILIIVLSFASCVIIVTNFKDSLHLGPQALHKPAILSLKLEGVILDGDEFLRDLNEYVEEEDIKGVLVQINSPGGVVGPSQEIYAALKRVRDELKKPVVVSVLGMGASGAYYAALGANKIVTNPGSLVGSIGVIMEFANLEKLYEWAKVSRYVIKTGNYKDSGAEYRPMREDERVMFQALADEVLAQFKKDIVDNRKLTPELVDQYSDGRVFTGNTAVKIGLADEVGTIHRAHKIVGELSGLGADAELFTPPVRREHFMDLFSEVRSRFSLENPLKEWMRTELIGQPLFLLPTVLPSR